MSSDEMRQGKIEEEVGNLSVEPEAQWYVEVGPEVGQLVRSSLASISAGRLQVLVNFD